MLRVGYPAVLPIELFKDYPEGIELIPIAETLDHDVAIDVWIPDPYSNKAIQVRPRLHGMKLVLSLMAGTEWIPAAVGPHVTRRVGGDLQDGADPGDWEPLDIDDRHLAVIRQGLFEVVNTPSGTAYADRLMIPGVQMAGKTGTAQVHNATAAEKAKNFNDATLAWADRPNGLFVGFAPYDAQKYAVAVIIEHGLWGAISAAPWKCWTASKPMTRSSTIRTIPLKTA